MEVGLRLSSIELVVRFWMVGLVFFMFRDEGS